LELLELLLVVGVPEEDVIVAVVGREEFAKERHEILPQAPDVRLEKVTVDPDPQRVVSPHQGRWPLWRSLRAARMTPALLAMTEAASMVPGARPARRGQDRTVLTIRRPERRISRACQRTMAPHWSTATPPVRYRTVSWVTPSQKHRRMNQRRLTLWA